jgi:predicted RNase H-like nuclease
MTSGSHTTADSDAISSKSTATPRVLGVDACKRGWVAIDNDLRGYFGRTIAEVVQSATSYSGLDAIAIDIPIGLPTRSSRMADSIARGLIGRRAPSVFTTPVRDALTAATHAEGSRLNVEATGKGISQRAYALRAKILQVDQWARESQTPVIEVHPEVCFAFVAGSPLRFPKSTWAGSDERRRILASVDILPHGDLGEAGLQGGPDDILDAAAAMCTASRFARGLAVAHPSEPERFGDGHAATTWV